MKIDSLLMKLSHPGYVERVIANSVTDENEDPRPTNYTITATRTPELNAKLPQHSLSDLQGMQ